MKTNLFLAIFVTAILLSITALSLSPVVDIINKKSQITPSIGLEENDICVTEFYEEIRDVYENCNYYHNYTHCLNTTGPDTDCSLQQNIRNFRCKTGENIIAKNKTTCRPDDKFLISIDNGIAVAKKQIDFSDWGPCIYGQENINGNSCLIVTCVSLYDGAHQGQFVDCKGGKSCQRFEICDDSVKTFYKNSREDFVEEDPSFHLNKLAIREAGK
jgi:hypothetical protein